MPPDVEALWKILTGVFGAWGVSMGILIWWLRARGTTIKEQATKLDAALLAKDTLAEKYLTTSIEQTKTTVAAEVQQNAINEKIADRLDGIEREIARLQPRGQG